MIDFTNCPVNRFRAYGGANGNKINITYQGHSYMLKFPPKPSRNRDMSYSNGCISEYVACHIFEMLGFRTQETLLGNYTDSRGKTKLVVACRDFTENGKRLIEFAHLKNTCIDSEQNGYGKELSSILEAIEEQSIYPSDELRQFFWDMFIADAFLGNFDTDTIFPNPILISFIVHFPFDISYFTGYIFFNFLFDILYLFSDIFNFCFHIDYSIGYF